MSILHNPQNDRLYTSASSIGEIAFAHDHQHAVHLLACSFAKCSPILKVFLTGADLAINLSQYDYENIAIPHMCSYTIL